MKPPRHIVLSKLSSVAVITFLSMILAATALAEPTVQPLGGRTCVLLDEGFAEALESLEISVGIIAPAFSRRAKVCFPISGGGIDLGENGKIELIHTGGLALIQYEATDEKTSVELTSFIIDITGDTPVLTGLVIVEGNLVGRLPLFDLDLEAAKIKQKYKFLSVRNVVLTLTSEAASALNSVFFDGEDVLEGGLKIGVAKVFALIFRGYYDGCNT
jgi:hypothetical protein